MTELFAAIREDSKYFHQNPKALPFPICIENTTDSYRVKGNGNQYRLDDVYLFVQSGPNFQQINKEIIKPLEKDKCTEERRKRIIAERLQDYRVCREGNQ